MTITPTSHDTTFVPYPMGLDKKFEACLPDTEVEEGVAWSSGQMPKAAYSDDKHDPGGQTGEGIIQKEYDPKRRQWGLPTRWVYLMSKDEERTIYYTDYWLSFCPALPAGLDLEFFDQNVNEGSHRAIVLLQLALKIPDDGLFGPQTMAAVKEYVTDKNVPALIDRYMLARESFYRGLPTFRYFGSDWIGRSVRIDKKANALAAAAAQK